MGEEIYFKNQKQQVKEKKGNRQTEFFNFEKINYNKYYGNYGNHPYNHAHQYYVYKPVSFTFKSSHYHISPNYNTQKTYQPSDCHRY